MLPIVNYSLFREDKEITHFTTTRKGGVSKGLYKSLNLGDHVGDTQHAVDQNRTLVKEAFNASQLVIPQQSHTANVQIVKTGDELLNDTDALITNVSKICIGVLTADCVPLLFFDTEKKVVGAVHAGWKGIINGVIENTLEAMKESFGVSMENIKAITGPCISQKRYEVGKDVWSQFSARFTNKEVETIIDHKKHEKALCCVRTAAKTVLKRYGITAIEVSQACTYEEEETFFSARRDGIHSGRQLTAIMLS